NASPREAWSRFRLNETDSQLEQEAMTSHPALVESHRGRVGCVDPLGSPPTYLAWRSSCRSAPSHDRGSRRWPVGFRDFVREPSTVQALSWSCSAAQCRLNTVQMESFSPNSKANGHLPDRRVRCRT